MKPIPLLTILLATVSTASSQPPIRAKLIGSPRLGRPAPALVLPYTPPECRVPSPECRAPSAEFRTANELGRVIIVAFGGRPDAALTIDWAALSKRADSLGSPRVVLVGVLRAGPEQAAALSGSLGGSLKILADSGGRVHRQFGVGDRDRDWTIFVVADDGTLVARERVNTLADGGWWAVVAPAIRRGFTAAGR